MIAGLGQLLRRWTSNTSDGTHLMITDSYSFVNGLLVGALALLFVFSLLIAWAYDEPGLCTVACMAALGVLDLNVQSPQLHAAAVPVAMATLLFAIGHSGGMRVPHRALLLVCVATGLVIGVSAGPPWQQELSPMLQLTVGLAWASVAVWLIIRAWARSDLWLAWLALAQALLFAGFALRAPIHQAEWLVQWLGWQRWQVQQLWTVFHILLFCVASYLGLVWRSRQLSETRLRITEYATRDPLTGCMTIKQFRRVLNQCVHRSNHLRYPSGVVLVCCTNLPDVANNIDSQSNESVIWMLSQLVRRGLRGHDSAVRLQNGMFGLLIEGLERPDHLQSMCSKLIADGLRHSVPDRIAPPMTLKVMASPIVGSPEQSEQWFAELESQFLDTLRLGQKRSIFELSPEQAATLLSPDAHLRFGVSERPATGPTGH